MRKIDTTTWKRKVPYKNFIDYTNPIFSLSTRLDVTELCNRCKKEGTSFFADFLYIVMRCLNSIEEFRLRIVNDEVVLYDTIHPSYIVLTDDNIIVTCRTEMQRSYFKFYKNVRDDIEEKKQRSIQDGEFNIKKENDCYYISCLPWVDLMGVSNPYNLNDNEQSSIPRLTWGKFVDENGRKKMTMDIAVHHALLDGEPVCRGFIEIQKALDHIEDYLK